MESPGARNSGRGLPVSTARPDMRKRLRLQAALRLRLCGPGVEEPCGVMAAAMAKRIPFSALKLDGNA